MSSEKAGFEPSPAYTGGPGYPQQPPGYAPQQAGYPSQPAYGQPAYGQPGYGQAGYTTNTTTGTVIVTQPGGPGVIHAYPSPPDYMAASIIACLCCFWPTGLCAIYFASQAKSAAAAGDMETATRMSNNARNLMITSIVIGVIWITLVIVLRVVVYSTTNNYSY